MSDAKLTKNAKRKKKKKEKIWGRREKIHIKIWMMLHKGYFNKIIQ